MDTQWILEWWNLVFAVPFLLAVLYLGMYAVSGITFGESDLDHDLGADHDLDADHDLSTDHDLHSSDGDASEHDLDSEQSGHVPAHVAAMSWLGLGKVPMSLILMVLLMTWGGIGFVTNQLVRQQVSQDWQVAIWSLPAAALGSLLLTRLMVMLMIRYVPLNETTARRRHELLGCEGETIFPVNAKFGMVSVRDDRGELHQVPCHAAPDAPGIAKGAKVRLVAYNARLDSFQVRANTN